jgi:hypothetical protein
VNNAGFDGRLPNFPDLHGTVLVMAGTLHGFTAVAELKMK